METKKLHNIIKIEDKARSMLIKEKMITYSTPPCMGLSVYGKPLDTETS